MKIRSVGDEMFHAEGLTDMPKLTVALRNFANAPKNVTIKTQKYVFIRRFVWPFVLKLVLKLKLNSVALVRERTIPTERPPPVGEVSANFCG
jgi:hypothetical protein